MRGPLREPAVRMQVGHTPEGGVDHLGEVAWQRLPATVRILYPRGDPRRGTRRRALEQVLACYRCNHDRGNEEAALLRELHVAGARVLYVAPPRQRRQAEPAPRRYRRAPVASIALDEARAAAAKVRESGLAEELAPRGPAGLGAGNTGSCRPWD